MATWDRHVSRSRKPRGHIFNLNHEAEGQRNGCGVKLSEPTPSNVTSSSKAAPPSHTAPSAGDHISILEPMEGASHGEYHAL